MIEFPKRHARKYSDRAGLTSYRGSRLVLTNPHPNRVVLGGERGQIIKISLQVLQATKKQQGKQKKERQKVLAKSKTTYRRGLAINMVLWDHMRDDGCNTPGVWLPHLHLHFISMSIIHLIYAFVELQHEYATYSDVLVL
jgi:hypothetical protein